MRTPDLVSNRETVNACCAWQKLFTLSLLFANAGSFEIHRDCIFLVRPSCIRLHKKNCFQQWLLLSNGQNIKNARIINPQLSIRWESIGIFYFKLIPPCLQQWLPMIIETSKMHCGMVISQVLDEHRWLFLILRLT